MEGSIPFEEFAEWAPSPIAITSPEGRLPWVNRAWQAAFGAREALQEILHPDDTAPPSATLPGEEAPPRRVLGVDGAWGWWRCAQRAHPGGGTVLMLAPAQAPRLHELEEQARLYRDIFNSTSDALFLHEESGRTIDVNERACAMYGRSREELLACSINELSLGEPPYSQAEAEETLRQAERSGSYLFRWRSRRKSGELFWSEIALQITQIGGKRRIIAAVRDVDSRVRAEETLRRNERWLALALSATEDAIWEYELRTREMYFSPRWYELLGYHDQEFPMNLGTWRALCHPNDFAATMRCLETTIEGAPDAHYDVEYRMRAKDGTWRWIQSRGRVLERDEQGTALILCGANSDITERKQVERALLASEERFRLLSTMATEGIMILRGEDVIDANAALARLVGLDDASSLLGPGRLGRITLSPQTQPLWSRVTKSSPATYDVELVQPGGTLIPVEVHGRDISYRGKAARLVYLRDLSERRRAEQIVEESERRFRLMIEHFNDILVLTEPNGEVRFVSAACQRVLGFSPEQMIGQKVQARVHPEDRSQARAARRTAPGASALLTLRHAHQDGSWRWLEVSATNLTEDPSFRGYVLAGRDITARKQAAEERARLEEGLRQAQKLESIGRLAGGVAHDFNNLLTAIGGNIDVARAELSPQHPVLENLREMRQAVDSAAQLTRQLLAFSRKQAIAPRPLDLNEVVANLRRMLQRLLGEDVALRTSLAPGLGTVLFDAVQAEQILLNLAVNARDAMPDGGTLTIETRDAERPGPDAVPQELPPGRYVALSVHDTGVGMSEEIKARIFEPFFSTKARGKGTGLGLAMVYGAIQQNQGHIHVESVSGQGARFTLYLPRSETAALPVHAPTPSPAPQGGNESIVLVEDEDLVRDVAVRLLRRRGYTVLSYPSGEAALHALPSIEGPLHLLLTDVVMPGMNGRALAEQVRAARPEIRVLFTSGYNETVTSRHGMIDPGIDFLPKPYTAEQLTRRIREVLERR